MQSMRPRVRILAAQRTPRANRFGELRRADCLPAMLAGMATSEHRRDGAEAISGERRGIPRRPRAPARYSLNPQTTLKLNCKAGLRWDDRLVSILIYKPPNHQTTMKLYLISQTENQNYDTHDSAVVCAPDESTARNMNPSGGGQMTEEKWSRNYSSWCRSADAVTVEYIGEAADGVKSGVVCASFNAG